MRAAQLGWTRADVRNAGGIPENYLARNDDTLCFISNKLGVDVNVLLKLNVEKYPDLKKRGWGLNMRLKEGTQLVVPTGMGNVEFIEEFEVEEGEGEDHRSLLNTAK